MSRAMQAMMGALALSTSMPALAGKRRRAPRRGSAKTRRRKVARQADHATQVRRFFRIQKRVDDLRKLVKRGELEPVHPRDHHWYSVGLEGRPFDYEPPTHGGGSYYARYLAMHEAGAAAREASS